LVVVIMFSNYWSLASDFLQTFFSRLVCTLSRSCCSVYLTFLWSKCNAVSILYNTKSSVYCFLVYHCSP
jgi:hypothetical protein